MPDKLAYVPPTIAERCRDYSNALYGEGGEWRDSMLPPLLFEVADHVEKLEAEFKLLQQQRAMG